MILPGVLALFVGAVLAFAVHGDMGGVGVGTVGVIVMILGALILIAGLLRLRRGSRQRVADGRDRVYRTSKGKIIAMVIATRSSARLMPRSEPGSRVVCILILRVVVRATRFGRAGREPCAPEC